MASQKTTSPAIQNFQDNDSQLKHTVAIILGFWLIYFLFYLLETPLHTFLKSYLYVLKSEYTVDEQLSRFYLFIIVLISVISYQVSNKPSKIKLSISFLLLGLILHMSENDMITNNTQPIFGLIIIFCTGMFLLRVHSYFSFTFFIVGFMVIGVGVADDFVTEQESIRSLLPTYISDLFLITREESFDVIGAAFLCLSTIVCFHVPLRNFVAKNKKGTLLMLLSSGMITVGNGLMHWKSTPNNKLHLVGLVTTISGFLGLMFICKIINKKDATLKLVTEKLFYFLVFLFFVLLPSIHGRARSWTAVLLWIPSMFFLAVYLWRCHPIHYGDVTVS